MKRLVIEVDTVFDKKAIRIKEQTHRCREFGVAASDDCREFVASNGFTLASQEYPSLDANALFVRGGKLDRDHTVLLAPDGEWLAKLRVAVREYNEKFEDKSETPEGYELIE